MKAIIISNGVAPKFSLLQKELIDSSVLICADGGANCVHSFATNHDFAKLPDFLIGDLDSIASNALEYFKAKNVRIEKYPAEKSFTDTELAVKKALELGATEIVFLGSLGNRIDHTFGNFGVLLKCLNLKVKACIKDENCTAFLADSAIKIYGNTKEVFSLQAYAKDVSNLCISGSKYELQNYDLKIGDNLTLSNEFLLPEVNIDFQSGNLLIIQCSKID